MLNLIAGIVDILKTDIKFGEATVPYWVIIVAGVVLIALIIVGAIILGKDPRKKREKGHTEAQAAQKPVVPVKTTKPTVEEAVNEDDSEVAPVENAEVEELQESEATDEQIPEYNAQVDEIKEEVQEEPVAEEIEEVTEESVEVATEETAEEPIAAQAEEVEAPEEVAADESVEEVTEEPIEEQAEQPEETVEEPVAEVVEEPVEEVAPVEEPTQEEESVEETAVAPVEEEDIDVDLKSPSEANTEEEPETTDETPEEAPVEDKVEEQSEPIIEKPEEAVKEESEVAVAEEKPVEEKPQKSSTKKKAATSTSTAPAQKKPATKKKVEEKTIDVPLIITPKKAKKEIKNTDNNTEVTMSTNENKANDVQKKGAVGKYEINLRSEGYCFALIANNGQLLYDSFGYASVDGAKAGIDTFKKAVAEGSFFASGDKFGRYRFILNKRYQGQNYSTKAACESSIKSVQRFADTDKIIVIEPTTEELEDYKASLKGQKKATDIDWEAVEKEEAATPRLGTFESYEDENGDFRFFLLANNKQILYTCSIYATAATVRGAIDNFKKAVYIGNFVIGKDKFGKFRYILRSSSAVTYVGESYTTEKQAKSASESVKRFVKSATILPCKKFIPEE